METQPPHKSKNKSSFCSGCGCKINDEYILQVVPDIQYHVDCLKCTACQQPLDEKATCFLRHGKPYCKSDYKTLFQNRCTKCNRVFEPSEFIMKAKRHPYHIDCFRCQSCTRKLIPGDAYGVDSDYLYCEKHYLSKRTEAIDDSTRTATITQIDWEKTDSPDHSVGVTKPQGTAIKCKHDASRNKGGKGTRIRTVLNEKQLQTLRSYYANNPRPDSAIKEKLVELTGLTSRVIRVWFQNKRCKDKKIKCANERHLEEGQSPFPYSQNVQQLPPVQNPTNTDTSLTASNDSAQSNIVPYSQAAWNNNFNDLTFVGHEERSGSISQKFQHQHVPTIQ